MKIGTVLTSFGVILSPIVYPKLFVRNASEGLEKLTTWRAYFDQTSDAVHLGYVIEGEEGFKEVASGADFIFGIEGEPEQICLAKGRPRDLGEVIGFGIKNGIGPNGVLFAKVKEGDPEILQWDPWSPKRTLNAETLKQGIRLKGQEKSHYITMTLAVIWATLSVITVL
ncbi:hypothetical protein [Natrinema gelatinilyticum]|uniref:hypothetical protein n=1 Tax=Natrinema gelatinilyticum TaxID=2961571 RepID=UPI0020C3D6E5|nr:hypothetical protein [Natrinema gelatinilyticum]